MGWMQDVHSAIEARIVSLIAANSWNLTPIFDESEPPAQQRSLRCKIVMGDAVQETLGRPQQVHSCYGVLFQTIFLPSDESGDGPLLTLADAIASAWRSYFSETPHIEFESPSIGPNTTDAGFSTRVVKVSFWTEQLFSV